MCQNCKNNSCSGCSYTYQNYPCPQFPPSPGPAGPTGPVGPQGPPGTPGPCPCPLNIVPILSISQPVYNVNGTEDVLLINTALGPVTVNLLPAALATRYLTIKDTQGTSGANDISIVPNGVESIDIFTGITSLFLKVGNLGAIKLVPRTNGYNII